MTPASSHPDPQTAPNRQVLALLLLAAALGMGIWGQAAFSRFDASVGVQAVPWQALGAFAGAIVAFVLAHAIIPTLPDHSASPRAWQPAGAVLHHPRRQGALLLLSGVQTIVLLALLAAEPPLPGYNWTVVLWLGAIACYLLALLPRNASPPHTHHAADWWHAWRSSLPVLLIVALALVLRTWNLGGIPPTLGGDEGSQGLEALDVLHGEIRNPFATGWLGVPTMSFYFNATTIGLLGTSMVALRLPWALVGTASVLVTYLLIRRLHGTTLAVMSAALLATYHYHIHFSRLGSNQIADTLFVGVALLFFYRAYDAPAERSEGAAGAESREGVAAGTPHRAYLNWAVCGSVVGLAQYFYAGARFTAVLIVALVGYMALRDGRRFWWGRSREVLVLVGAVLIVAAPMLQYALRFPNEYNARLNQVGIIQSGWLEQEQEIRGQGAVPILLDQVQRAALAFNLYRDRTFWYGSPEPLFHFAAAVLFLLGLGYATLHLFNRRLAPMVAWWWGAMLLGGAFTESPPSSMRLITLSVPAVFFVALTLLRSVQVLRYALATRHAALFVRPLLTGAVVLFSLQSIWWYFVEYTPQRIYGNPDAVVATALGHYAHEHLGADWRIYFFGAPRMYVGFGTIPYLAPDVEGSDIHDVSTEPPPPVTIPADKHALFVFLPHRRDELALVQQRFPDGQVIEMPHPDPAEDEPLFTMYMVDRSMLGGVSDLP